METITNLEPDIKEIEAIIKEATQDVEQELRIEDDGWIKLGNISANVTTEQERIASVQRARVYYIKDPLARQSIRLWTDYTFGSGMTWNSEDEKVTESLNKLWDNEANRSILSAQGQRTSSDKLLVDGEIFFALFLGAEGEVKIRRINPLEITEIITDPDDIEDIKYYRRQWSNRQNQSKETIYRSISNKEDKATLDMSGKSVQSNDEALVYHLAINTLEQRGYSLLLPASDWIRQYRRFLASRIAVMLALARFAWKTKVTGGQTQVDNMRAVLNQKSPAAGSQLLENLLSDTQPIKTDSGASQAYQDGRMIKLQVAAAVGIPEQYYGDISIGNLATAKTVELPMMKMFQSYQKVWADAYQTIDEVVLVHNDVPEDKWYVDRDFPPIAPEDVAAGAQAITSILSVMPNLGDSPDVQQTALMLLGINNTSEVLDALKKTVKESPEIALTRALRQIKELSGNGHK
jgi:hypothetical protein